jgi:hypothetical protein
MILMTKAILLVEIVYIDTKKQYNSTKTILVSLNILLDRNVMLLEKYDYF